MDPVYSFWRTRHGVPDSIMPPFRYLLTEQDIWDLTAFISSLVGVKFGG